MLQIGVRGVQRGNGFGVGLGGHLLAHLDDEWGENCDSFGGACKELRGAARVVEAAQASCGEQ